MLPTLFGVKQREVMDFTSQLATLVESGVPLLTSLRLLLGQNRRKAFSRIMERLIDGIQGAIHSPRPCPCSLKRSPIPTASREVW